MPWEDNLIGISADQLPMDMQIDLAEVRVRPPADTVVTARFPARRTRAAVVRVVHADGRPVAPGTRARLDPQPRDATVPFGLSGEIYLSDLQDRNRLWVDAPAGRCVVDFDGPPASALQPTLGPWTCREPAP
jgi:outer membrane usher protein